MQRLDRAYLLELQEKMRIRLEEAKQLAEINRALGITDAIFEPPTPDPCPTCHGASWLGKPYNPRLNPIMEIMPGPDCQGEIKPIEKLILESRMHHVREVTFAVMHPARWQKDQWGDGKKFADHPQGWFWMVGGFDVGKTTLAFCIGNTWLDRGKRVLYRKVALLLDELRSGYSKDADVRYQPLMDEVLNTPYLILDDYGKQVDTEWAMERLFQITDHRLEHNLVTVVTTNMSMTKLRERNERLFTRVDNPEKVQVVFFPGQQPNKQWGKQ